MFALRLQRIGRAARSISADAHAPEETTIVLTEAQTHGVPVIVLTEALTARFADLVSVALIAPRSAAGGFKTLTTTGVLLDSLLLGVAARDRATSLLNLERFDRLRSQLIRRRATAPPHASD